MGYGDIIFFWILIVSMICIWYKAFGDNMLIDCGSYSNTTVGDRVFMADTYSSKYLTTPIHILSNGSCESELMLFKTARIFKGETKYTLPISQFGRYLLRLYFYPLSHSSFDLREANFSISVSQYYVLTDFHPPPSPVMKEYSFNVTMSDLEIVFEPAHNSMAFLNALEIVLVPNNLIHDKSSSIHTTHTMVELRDRAFETMSRVNMGGSFISYENDSLWRTWIPDDDFLKDKNFTRVVKKNTKVVRYANSGDLAAKDDAPPAVYSSCRRIKTQYDPSDNFSMTWSFEIDQGFQYFLRFHFCDIVSLDLGEIHINVYVNSWTVTQSLDISVMSKRRLATPIFLDFVTPDIVDSKQINVHIVPSLINQHEAILNGLEIMKMNNFRKLNAIVVPPVPHTSQSDSSSKSMIGVVTGETIGVCTVLVFASLVCLFSNRNKNLIKGGSTLSTSSHSPIVEISIQNTNTTLQSDVATCLSFATIEKATSNFDESHIIGRGGFGKVYMGRLDNGEIVAIKRGHNQSQPERRDEFVNEIVQLSRFKHRNLVSLVGYCAEQNELIIVYQYMENGSLKSHLYGSGKLNLGWTDRLKICIGAANGIHYLHTGIDNNKVIHRDIKSANILLDGNLNAKIADFGISKIFLDELTSVETGVKGTFGYMDPNYVGSGKLSDKSDVYSFGALLYEVICARPVYDRNLPEDQTTLIPWALDWQRKDQLGEIIDSRIKGTIRPDCLQEYGAIAMDCVVEEVHRRPTMGKILSRLEKLLEMEIAPLDNVPESSTNEIDENIPDPEPDIKDIPNLSFPGPAFFHVIEEANKGGK